MQLLVNIVLKMMARNLRGELSVFRSTHSMLLEADTTPRVASFLNISSDRPMFRAALFPTLIAHCARIGDINMLRLLKNSVLLIFRSYEIFRAQIWLA